MLLGLFCAAWVPIPTLTAVVEVVPFHQQEVFCLTLFATNIAEAFHVTPSDIYFPTSSETV